MAQNTYQHKLFPVRYVNLFVIHFAIQFFSNMSFILTAVFLKPVQCQSQLNCKIQPYVVQGIHFTHT